MNNETNPPQITPEAIEAQRLEDARIATSQSKRFITIPLSIAIVIRSVFLPANPNKMRKAHPDVVAAAKRFIAAVNEPLQFDNPAAPNYDWQRHGEWYSQRLANAHIHNSELEQKIARLREQLRCLAQAVVYEDSRTVGAEGPSWELLELAKSALKQS